LRRPLGSLWADPEEVTVFDEVDNGTRGLLNDQDLLCDIGPRESTLIIWTLGDSVSRRYSGFLHACSVVVTRASSPEHVRREAICVSLCKLHCHSLLPRRPKYHGWDVTRNDTVHSICNVQHCGCSRSQQYRDYSIHGALCQVQCYCKNLNVRAGRAFPHTASSSLLQWGLVCLGSKNYDAPRTVTTYRDSISCAVLD
jgi:hypothetical protein